MHTAQYINIKTILINLVPNSGVLNLNDLIKKADISKRAD